nr:unnamed protein product [Callosobruchus chinensis]
MKFGFNNIKDGPAMSEKGVKIGFNRHEQAKFLERCLSNMVIVWNFTCGYTSEEGITGILALISEQSLKQYECADKSWPSNKTVDHHIDVLNNTILSSELKLEEGIRTNQGRNELLQLRRSKQALLNGRN